MPYRIRLSKPLKEKKRNMTLMEIASEAGVSKNTVMKYMRSDFESVDLYDSASKLAEFCGLDPNNLTGWADFFREDEETPEKANITPEAA